MSACKNLLYLELCGQVQLATREGENRQLREGR